MEEAEYDYGPVRDGLSQLQRIQHAYDQEMWEIASPAFNKMRHISIHVSVAAGELAALVETWDHEFYQGGDPELDSSSEMATLVADLTIYATQLSNLANLNLSHCLSERYRTNVEKNGPDPSYFRTL